MFAKARQRENVINAEWIFGTSLRVASWWELRTNNSCWRSSSRRYCHSIENVTDGWDEVSCDVWCTMTARRRLEGRCMSRDACVGELCSMYDAQIIRGGECSAVNDAACEWDIFETIHKKRETGKYELERSNVASWKCAVTSYVERASGPDLVKSAAIQRAVATCGCHWNLFIAMKQRSCKITHLFAAHWWHPSGSNCDTWRITCSTTSACGREERHQKAWFQCEPWCECVKERDRKFRELCTQRRPGATSQDFYEWGARSNPKSVPGRDRPSRGKANSQEQRSDNSRSYTRPRNSGVRGTHAASREKGQARSGTPHERFLR